MFGPNRGIRSPLPGLLATTAALLCLIARNQLAFASQHQNYQQQQQHHPLQLHSRLHKLKLQQTNQANSGNDGSVDDILGSTMALLDVLDRKLAQVSNGTLVRETRSTPEVTPKSSDKSIHQQPSEDDLELIRLAAQFAPVKQSQQAAGQSEPTTTSAAAVSEQQQQQQQQVGFQSAKKARQLAADEHSAAADFTQRHIGFTLDLMRSIVEHSGSARHSSSSSSSSSGPVAPLESFIISPLSIQMVLMMLHLGARGQTRRELAQCLQLAPTSNSSSTHTGSGRSLSFLDPASLLEASSKLRRRTSEQKQQQQSSNAKPPKQTLTPVASTTGSPSSSHELFGTAIRSLARDPAVAKALASANQIFLQKSLRLSGQYEAAIKHHYGADVKMVDFRQDEQSLSTSPTTTTNAPLAPGISLNETNFQPTTPVNQSSTTSVQRLINDWVEKQTRGTISNFLATPLSAATLMMALNVLFFKGDWQYKFDPVDTQNDSWFTRADGSTVRLPMMVARLPLAYSHQPQMKTSVVELPYKAHRLGLFILLPDELNGLPHTLSQLNASSLASLIASMRKPGAGSSAELGGAAAGVNIRLPRFRIESSPKMARILTRQLGLKSLFNPELADLSGMFATEQNSSPPPQVGLDELLHKAVLQVDEQGSVAAASSASVLERVGNFNAHYFEADHPFLLFLLDKQTGLILFSGVFAGDSPAVSNSSSNRR